MHSYLDLYNFEVTLTGPDDSPFEGKDFRLSIIISEKYPFEPPTVKFLTPIYHPNIDINGRICLDTIKSPPQGSWSPSVNIHTVLVSIRLLMANPNSEDGLVPEITEEFNRDIETWKKKAYSMNSNRYSSDELGALAKK